MAENNNPHLYKKLVKDLKLNKNFDDVPKKLASSIVATYPLSIEPEDSQIVSSGRVAATGNSSMFTVPSDREFWIYAANMGIMEDAASDNINTQISCTQHGKVGSFVLIGIPKIALTAIQDSVNISLKYPVRSVSYTHLTLPTILLV